MSFAAALLLVPITFAAGSVERRLYPDRVDASSFLWNDWNKFQENYHPLYAVDDDPVTAWVEGASGPGVGEWVRFDVTDLDGTTGVRLRVRNGYQKSSSLWKANARAREVTVRLLPGGQTAKVTLTDTEGWQELTLNQPSGPLDAVELRVGSVYPGAKYEDLCISDVEVYATSSARDNPVAETTKLGRVKAWKAERVAAAAVFKLRGASPMPVAPAYRVRAVAPEREYVGADDAVERMGLVIDRLAATPSTPALARATREVNLAAAAVRDRFAGWLPVRVSPTDSRPIPVVDGLGPASLWSCFDGPSVWGDVASGEAYGAFELPTAGKVAWLTADTLGAFETQDSVTLEKALAANAPGCTSRSDDGRPAATYNWARMAPATAERPARVEALLTVGCGTVEVREGSDQVATMHLLVFDAAGRLTVLAGSNFATQYGWRTEGAGAVITSGFRVGSYGPDLVLTEGRAAATP